jgi:hypothetical protein
MAMKKLAIGCGIVVLVVGVAFVGIVYYGYTKVRSTVNQIAELGQAHDIERGVKVQTPFLVPTSGELTAAQVDKLMKVTSRVRERLDQDMALFQRTYKALADKKEATAADLPALMSAYRDLAKDWLNAKRAQVDALNEAGLSVDEYRWIRSSAYSALDIPFMDVDFGRIADQVKNAGGQVNSAVLVGGAFAGKGPASNLKLVEKYRKQLEDYIPLAAFGL